MFSDRVFSHSSVLSPANSLSFLSCFSSVDSRSLLCFSPAIFRSLPCFSSVNSRSLLCFSSANSLSLSSFVFVRISLRSLFFVRLSVSEISHCLDISFSHAFKVLVLLENRDILRPKSILVSVPPPVAICKEVNAMTRSSSLPPISRVFISIGKGHFAGSVTATLQILTVVPYNEKH